MEIIEESEVIECPDINFKELYRDKIISKVSFNLTTGEFVDFFELVLEKPIEREECKNCKYFKRCFLPILSIDDTDPISIEAIPELVNKLNEIYQKFSDK